MIEDAIARVVFFAFTLLATVGAFFVGRHFRGGRLGVTLAAITLGGLLVLAWALNRLLAGVPAG